MNEIGKALRQLRVKRNISQSNIEKKIDIKREYLSKMESGDLKNPTVKTLKRIVNSYGIKLSEFFKMTEMEDNTILEAIPERPIISKELIENIETILIDLTKLRALLNKQSAKLKQIRS